MSKINAKHKKDKHFFFFTFERREFSQIKSTTKSLFSNSGIWILVNVAFVDIHENPDYQTPAHRPSILQDPF